MTASTVDARLTQLPPGKRARATLHRREAVPISPITLLIADDHAVIRDGLRALFAKQADFRVVADAAAGRDVVRLVMEASPNLLLLDLSMPDLSGLDVMRELRRCVSSPPRTILFTEAVEKADMLKFLRLGGRGIVLKNTPTQLLFKSLRKVHAGEVWIGREMIGDIVDTLAETDDVGQGSPLRDIGLTQREQDVLVLVLEGETNLGIARRLKLAEDTVKHHLTNVFDKTGVSNRLELALFALHHRLVKTA